MDDNLDLEAISSALKHLSECLRKLDVVTLTIANGNASESEKVNVEKFCASMTAIETCLSEIQQKVSDLEGAIYYISRMTSSEQ
ncbi:hypothetical protein DICVIV_09810 [Dictyocaulus viviparus]|uniref:Uncharacterized protein n=1 Tax=Dictyocaulus viviparus TaxID=29172 RepID=A0A0D8XK99_DICVI|nr:hypothetical protein DICVIV_09810 [Dictyocaulus viviparus]